MDVLDLANRLEGILRRYLNCGYDEFGVKANGNLNEGDWGQPIAFALGDKYAASGRNEDLREQIDYFLGNTLEGKNISDLVSEYEYYGYNNQKEAFDKANEIIDEVERLLEL